MTTTPSPAELVKALHDLVKQATTERSHYYVKKVAQQAASMIEALVKEIPSHEDRVLRMMTEDAAKIIDQLGFTRGYKAGLEAGANIATKGWDYGYGCGKTIAEAIRVLPIPDHEAQ